MKGKKTYSKIVCLGLILVLLYAGGIAWGQTKKSPSPEELYETAFSDYNKGDYDLAISGFRTYLSLFPKGSKAPEAQYWLAMSYFGQGNYLQAIKEFQAVVRDYPKSKWAPLAMLWMGDAYLKLGEKAKTRSTLQDILTKYPDSILAEIAKIRLGELAIEEAMAYEKAGQKDLAIRAYREAIRLKPDYYSHHRRLADLYGDVGQLDQAIAEYKEAIRLTPREESRYLAETLYNLGITYLQKIEELQKAQIEAYQEAIRVNLGYVRAHYNLGIVFYNKSIGKTGTEKRVLLRQAKEQFLLVIDHAKENPEEQELKIRAQELIRVIDYWLRYTP